MLESSYSYNIHVPKLSWMQYGITYFRKKTGLAGVPQNFVIAVSDKFL